MDNIDKAKALIIKELNGSDSLKDLAADMLLHNWQCGYCEVTEHPKMFELLRPLACKWCGIIHSKSYPHHEQLSTITEDQWEAARNKFPETISPVLLAEQAGLITPERQPAEESYILQDILASLTLGMQLRSADQLRQFVGMEDKQQQQ